MNFGGSCVVDSLSLRFTVLAVLAACCLASCGKAKQPDPAYTFSDPRVLALIKAVDREDLPEIDQLVAAGVDINAVGESLKLPGQLYVTPLIAAFNRERKASFERLLKLGADPNQAVRGYGAVIQMAARAESDSDWLRLVLEHRGDPNLRGNFGSTPLFDVVFGRRVENLRLLIEAGADINHRDGAGSTALIGAAQMLWFEGAFYLLQAGTDYRLKTSERNYDLAYYVIENPIKDGNDVWQWREEVIDFLEAKGFDFEPAFTLVEKERPLAAPFWKQNMQRRAEEKEKKGR
jgi:ankyrin repeat protein